MCEVSFLDCTVGFDPFGDVPGSVQISEPTPTPEQLFQCSAITFHAVVEIACDQRARLRLRYNSPVQFTDDRYIAVGLFGDDRHRCETAHHVACLAHAALCRVRHFPRTNGSPFHRAVSLKSIS